MDALIVKNREKIKQMAQQRGILNVHLFGSMSRNMTLPPSQPSPCIGEGAGA
jgi:predicted nucleotidyltransferase